jgi:glutathione peroxidase
MKNGFIFLLLTLFASQAIGQKANFHSFKAETIDGKQIDLKSLKGKKVLVVNVASKCGLTPQYKELQALYQKYGGDKFEIIAFPANNFREQEPGTNAEIIEFCTKNYGVTFPVMAKISVKGEDMAPLYKWLTHKSENGVTDAEVTWNFQKFMINEDGSLAGYVSPKTKPDDAQIINWIIGK